jgi:hypothetical protein
MKDDLSCRAAVSNGSSFSDFVVLYVTLIAVFHCVFVVSNPVLMVDSLSITMQT